MKLFKKILSVVLTVTLLCSLCVFSVKAAESVKIALSSANATVTETNAGTAKVDISISDNTDGLAALSLRIYYKEDVLSIEESKKIDVNKSASGTDTLWKNMTSKYADAINDGDYLTQTLKNSNDTTNISSDRSTNGWKMASIGFSTTCPGGISGNGVLASIEFTAEAGLESCETPIEVEVVKATSAATSNPNLPTTTENGKITVNGIVPKADAVTLETEDPITVNGTAGGSVQATATSTKGTDITSKATWTVTPASAGVTVSNSGLVTVGAKAQEGDYTVTAACGGKTATATLTVKREAAVVTTVEINSVGDTDVIGVNSSKTYTATVKDQYGDAVTTLTPVWTLEENGDTTNITLSGSTVTIANDDSVDGKTAVLKVTCDGKSDSVTITAKKVSMNWGTYFTQKSAITYGDNAESAFTKKSTNGQATAYIGGSEQKVNGTFAISADDLSAGDKTVTVTFTVTQECVYKGTQLTKDYSVKVNPKEVGLTWNNAEPRTYDTAPSNVTATATGLISGDTCDVTVDGGKETNAGTHTAEAKALSNANYKLPANATKQYVINKAIVPVPTIESATYNKEQKKAALDPTNLYTVTANDGGTDVGKYDVVLTLSDSKNYKWNTVDTAAVTLKFEITKATQTITVSNEPTVKYTSEPLTLTEYASTDDKDTGAALTFTKKGGTLNANYFTLTGATLTLNSEAIAKDAKTLFADQSKTYTVILNVNSAATKNYNAAEAKTLTVTVSYKDVVEVTGASVTDTTYGEDFTLTYPVGKIGDDTKVDNTATNWTVTYRDAAGKESAEKPVNAGSYEAIFAVSDTNDTYIGSQTVEFTIAQKEVGLTWNNATTRTYDNTASNITATATGLIKEDTCDVTVDGGKETNAGTHTAEAKALSNANYKLPDKGTTTEYVIEKADRNLTVEDLKDITLYPTKSTYQIKASTDTDLDKSAKITYSSNKTDAVTVNNKGLVSVLANGEATITVSIEETTNYKAAESKTFTVTAWKQIPITKVDAGEKRVAEISGNKIIVSGTKGSDETFAVTFTFAKESGFEQVDGEKANEIVVKFEDSVIATYTVDTTNVVEKNEHVDINAGENETTVSEDIPEEKKTDVENALKDSSVDGVSDSVFKELQDAAAKLLKGDVENVKVEIAVAFEAKALTDTSFKLDITPKYTVKDDKGETLQEPTKVPNGFFKTKVTVRVKLPEEFPTEKNLIAKHTIGKDSYEWLSVVVIEGVAEWQMSSFSEVELIVDERSATVGFEMADGSVQTKTYGPTDIGTAFPTDSKSGYTFNGWIFTDGGAAIAGFTGAQKKLTDELLTKLSEATDLKVESSFTAEYHGGGGGGAATEPTPYAVTVGKVNNGKISTDLSNAKKGDTVTVTVTPDNGFTLETLKIVDKNGKEITIKDLGDGKFSFTMPQGKVDIKATFMEDNTMLNFFVDVKADDYYYDAVLWAATNDVTKGTDDVHFAPEASCTRAQTVTFLWRAAGSPEPKSATNPFADVKADAYYYKAVLWAIEQGITNGVSETSFAPEETVDRSQVVTFLFRNAKAAAVQAASQFTDVDSSAYYADAVAWAVSNEITNGTSATAFSPADDCTRAQIVTFLYRYFVK